MPRASAHTLKVDVGDNRSTDALPAHSGAPHSYDRWIVVNARNLGYTSPAKLAGKGGSAGGILIGRAFTERPDLFGMALDDVGLSA